MDADLGKCCVEDKIEVKEAGVCDEFVTSTRGALGESICLACSGS